MESTDDKAEKYTHTTPISNTFIDEYMIKANATFVKIYLYGYRNYYHGIYGVTAKQIANNMDLLESDVILAWKYWEQKGIMKLYHNIETNVYEINYLAINMETKKIEESQTQNRPYVYNIVATKPQYSPQEISTYMENQEIKELFKYATNTLNKLLTFNDMNVIFSFYDWLRMPIEVIKKLLSYYSNKNLNYIEKVAVDWSENEIDSVEKVEELMQTHGDYKAIMKAFGLIGRVAIPKEEEYMKKWLNEYKFSIDIIKEACERTIMKTSNANFEYANSILTKWYENNVKTKEDIAKEYELFTQQKKLEAENKISDINQTIYKKNRFTNYPQRKWDFDRIEKLELEYNKIT